MQSPLNRRRFLLSTAQLLAAAPLTAFIAPRYQQQADDAATASPKPNPPAKPPALLPDLVQAVVGQAHRSLDEVKKLVDATPLLANACWDWGGGDFETPLQAAAHTGGHEIAAYLLRKGARPDIYAAAMLGHLDFVKAALAVDPKAHEIPGPHGFTLLHCAREGGETGKPVHDWLLAQGVPDVTFRPLPFIRPAGTAPSA